MRLSTMSATASSMLSPACTTSTLATITSATVIGAGSPPLSFFVEHLASECKRPAGRAVRDHAGPAVLTGRRGR